MKFRFLNQSEQMAASTGNVTDIANDFETIFNTISAGCYEFVPFAKQPANGEFSIKRTIADDGSVIKRGRLVVSNKTLSARLWDRDVPIPDDVDFSELEFGTARQGDEVVSDLIETPNGTMKVPRMYVRMKLQ